MTSLKTINKYLISEILYMSLIDKVAITESFIMMAQVAYASLVGGRIFHPNYWSCFKRPIVKSLHRLWTFRISEYYDGL